MEKHMSDATKTQTGKTQPKGKGLGRGLGSLLGNSGEGAFSKTAPGGDKALEALTAKLPSQANPAIKEGFIETKTQWNPPLNTEAQTAPAQAAPVPVPVPPAPVVPPHMRIWQIAIENLFPNPNQPRQIFEKEPLQELANSIKEKGII